MTAIELRNKLLDSPALADCGDPYGACMMLSSQNEYGDADFVYIFSRTYKRNICIHLHSRDKVWHLHDRSEESEYVHLHLEGLHLTPSVPMEESVTTAQLPDISRASMPPGQEYEPIEAVGGANSEDAGEVAARTADSSPRQHDVLTHYLTAEARPTYASPPWAREADYRRTIYSSTTAGRTSLGLSR